MYKIIYSKKAVKQIDNLKAAKLDNIVKNLIEIIRQNPFQYPPSFHELKWDLKGLYSRRISYQHRLVYKVDKKNKTVFIISMWSHYE